MEARALVQLLAGERARFVRMARARVASEADADDVVQRAMTRAADRSASIVDPSSARAWFYRILRRTIVDHHRAARRDELATATEVDAENIAAPAPARQAPTCRCAVHLLDELRPAYADVLRRIDFGDENPSDIAASLGVSTANLYVRLHRARRALRERVQGHCGVTSIEPCLECMCHAHARCGSSGVKSA
jgi:RNA polymerase sigma-70 factor (ECF subfamily)